MRLNNKNCFDEIRLTLAVIVMFSHFYVVSGAEVLRQFSLFFDANFAVKSFFAISGYLVTKSYLNSDSLRQYIDKRIRRISPAYVFVIVYCFIIGMVVTTLPWHVFFSSEMTYRYVFSNLLLMNFIEHSLPGVFADNKLAVMNGSLWTIKVEVMLYVTVPFILFAFRQFGHLISTIIIFIGGVVWFTYFSFYFDHPLGVVLARQMPGQLPYFIVGSFFAVARLSNRFWNVSLIISTVYMVVDIPLLIAQYVNMLMYPLFIIALSRVAKLSIGIGKMGDLSYGVYLFHFPTLQLIAYTGLFLWSPWLAAFIAVLITFFMAYVSWHFVESKYLNGSSHYVAATTRLSNDLK